MGIGEMMGVKQIKITPKTKMTLEEVYEAIKGLEFDAGAPEIVKHGFNTVIAFPPEDRENQVWVIMNKDNVVVQRSVVVAGLKESIKNGVKAELMNQLTGGVTGLISTFGGPKKACMAHCDDVANKIKTVLC